MGTPNGIGTNPMFQSANTFTIDESKLCFNKTHFNRPDFNVERFMKLARQKADLKTIQQDLRLYLKSVQNSMIELINDDYADFVHLSSNLVSLQESLNKIDHDIDQIWQDFQESTKDSVGTAERIEQKCQELSLNREKQSDVRDRIAFLSAIEKLAEMLRNPPKQLTTLWLQKVASFVVELKSTRLLRSDEERKYHQMVLSRLEKVLSEEGVQSASTDCSTLPIILSILSITDCTDSLTTLLVSDLLYPKFVKQNSNPYQRLVDVFEDVMQMRQTWSKQLAQKFQGKIRSFLDETLLTFVLTFIDKCMGSVAVPSDTRLFHKCYMETQKFIENWPSAKFSREMLKIIREKFNLLVYFKLETHKFSKQIEEAILPENFEVLEGTSEDFLCKTSVTVFNAIEYIWSDEVYIPAIVDKLWDFTLRQILKYYSWGKTMEKVLTEEKSEDSKSETWKKLLFIRTDAEKLQSQIFDFALENIWTKLRDLEVDTSQFGQCLTKHGNVVDKMCKEIDGDIVSMFVDVVKKELSLVLDVPKQYRWTKKPAPSTNSGYVKNCVEMIDGFKNELEKIEHPEAEELLRKVTEEAFAFFALKAKEVQDGVEATGSSLSRFKRKNATEGAVTDDDKIKIQIYHDAAFLLARSQELEITVEGLATIVDRCRDSKNTVEIESEA